MTKKVLGFKEKEIEDLVDDLMDAMDIARGSYQKEFDETIEKYLVPVVSLEEANRIAKGAVYLCMREVELNWTKKHSLKQKLNKLIKVDDWIDKQFEENKQEKKESGLI